MQKMLPQQLPALQGGLQASQHASVYQQRLQNIENPEGMQREGGIQPAAQSMPHGPSPQIGPRGQKSSLKSSNRAITRQSTSINSLKTSKRPWKLTRSHQPSPSFPFSRGLIQPSYSSLRHNPPMPPSRPSYKPSRTVLHHHQRTNPGHRLPLPVS